PPGHKVVVFRPIAEPRLAKSESGCWILNFGDGRDTARPLELIERFVETGTAGTVIWILDAAFLRQVPDPHALAERVAALKRSSPHGLSHCAVFAGDAVPWKRLMEAFKAAGIGVHYADPDGACFVEVHRPDGIVVGMAGPPL